MTTPLVAPQVDTRVEERTEADAELDKGKYAHIVKVEPGLDAAAVVLEARINGTPVEALCGHRWVPSRDPKQLPVCPACKEIYEMYRMVNDGLGETPRPS
jgi:hypothetical protein